MSLYKWVATTGTAVFMAFWTAGFAAEAPAGTIRVAVVTGGHGFDPKAFFALFEGYADVSYTSVAQKPGEEVFASADDFPYDAIVLYNFNQKITPRERENLVKLVERGVGLVVLHHAAAAYPDWPEFVQLGGACYHLRPYEQDGVQKPGSGVKFNVTYKVHVADRDHPITKGMDDFEVTDETYIRCSIAADLKPLLTTEEPSSDQVIGGVRTQGKGRVFYTQLGHDAKVYTHPSYRKLIIRAIRWVAGRPTEP